MRKEKTKKIWPFENSGFLSGRQLLEILLIKRKDELEKELLREGRDEICVSDLTRMYRAFLSESILGLSEEERGFLMKESGEPGKSEGKLKMLLNLTDWTLTFGGCCTMQGNHGIEISANDRLFKKAVFLKSDDEEETERLIRILTIEETGRELTGAEPLIETAHLTAVRPPAGSWGMRIRGRKGRTDEKHFL
jgi:hypothetical protein